MFAMLKNSENVINIDQFSLFGVDTQENGEDTVYTIKCYSKGTKHNISIYYTDYANFKEDWDHLCEITTIYHKRRV